jgi:hypothetical protein
MTYTAVIIVDIFLIFNNFITKIFFVLIGFPLNVIFKLDRYYVTRFISPSKLLECGFEARGLGQLWIPQELPGLQ